MYGQCEQCGRRYENFRQLCQPCQINRLKNNFANWTSNNKQIDDFIQKQQLQISLSNTRVFEWIPYDRLNNIEKMNKDDFATAIWKDGPLNYNKKWMRNSNKKVDLKYISQNLNELLNKV